MASSGSRLLPLGVLSTVERSEDWWQEINRSGISKEIQECKGYLIQLFVCAFLPAGVFLVLILLAAAGVRLEGPILGKAGPIAILVFGGGPSGHFQALVERLGANLGGGEDDLGRSATSP